MKTTLYYKMTALERGPDDPAKVELTFKDRELFHGKDKVDEIRSEVEEGEHVDLISIETKEDTSVPEVQIAQVEVHCQHTPSIGRIQWDSKSTGGKVTLSLDVYFPRHGGCEHHWSFEPADGPAIPLKVQVKRKN